MQKFTERSQIFCFNRSVTFSSKYLLLIHVLYFLKKYITYAALFTLLIPLIINNSGCVYIFIQILHQEENKYSFLFPLHLIF
jgi:LytS/YehU family sensor histidine kinase